LKIPKLRRYKMCAEKTKKRKHKEKCEDFENDTAAFKKMFEMMSRCCTEKSGFSNCLDMMERMKATCCGQKAEDTKTD
jgi:hypothetical protein